MNRADTHVPVEILPSLEQLLARWAAETRSDAIVVSDEDGLVIGGYGGTDKQAALAVWSTAPTASRRQAQQSLQEAGIDGPVHAVPLNVGAGRVVLASFGGGALLAAVAADALVRVLG